MPVVHSTRRRGGDTLNWLTKFCTYKRITFFRTHGPRDPRFLPCYVQEMKRKNVHLLVRTTGSNFEQSDFISNQIAVLDINFQYSQVPANIALEAITALFQKYIAEDDFVSVAIEGYDNSGFLIAYCLMELGMERRRAITTVEAGEGEVSFMQYYYLRQKGIDMNLGRRRKCTIL